MTSLLARDHGLSLSSESDALDIVSSDMSACILFPEDLHPNFFDLSNQIAGNVFQKFVNYRFRIAIVLPVAHGYGARIDELVRDHRAHPFVRFFNTAEAALDWLE